MNLGFWTPPSPWSVQNPCNMPSFVLKLATPPSQSRRHIYIVNKHVHWRLKRVKSLLPKSLLTMTIKVDSDSWTGFLALLQPRFRLQPYHWNRLHGDGVNSNDKIHHQRCPESTPNLNPDSNFWLFKLRFQFQIHCLNVPAPHWTWIHLWIWIHIHQHKRFCFISAINLIFKDVWVYLYICSAICNSGTNSNIESESDN